MIDDDKDVLLVAPTGFTMLNIHKGLETQEDPYTIMTFTYNGKPLVVQATMYEEPWQPVAVDLNMFYPLGQVVSDLINDIEANPGQVSEIDGYIVDEQSIVRWSIGIKENTEGLTIEDVEEEDVTFTVPVSESTKKVLH